MNINCGISQWTTATIKKGMYSILSPQPNEPKNSKLSEETQPRKCITNLIQHNTTIMIESRYE